MLSVLISLVLTLRGIVRSRAALHLEVLALCHRLQALQAARTSPIEFSVATGSGSMGGSLTLVHVGSKRGLYRRSVSGGFTGQRVPRRRRNPVAPFWSLARPGFRTARDDAGRPE